MISYNPLRFCYLLNIALFLAKSYRLCLVAGNVQLVTYAAPRVNCQALCYVIFRYHGIQFTLCFVAVYHTTPD